MMEQDDIYFHPLIACTSCGLVTKDWKWVENPDDELIYGCCFECEDKVKKEGLGVFE